MAQVAGISANNDEAIGELIGEVMEKVGKDGVVTVEESNGIKTEVEYVEGMQFERGYVSPYFVTDPGKMEAGLEDAYIFIRTRSCLPSPTSCRSWNASSRSRKTC